MIGLAKAPLGGQSSDVYVKLTQLQALSDRKGRVNTVYVRAKSRAGRRARPTHSRQRRRGVRHDEGPRRPRDRLARGREEPGRQARHALAVVALLSAFLIASLLTLSSVAKRVRELGTLKALGWSQWLVVRQVSGEALVQGCSAAFWASCSALPARPPSAPSARSSGDIRERADGLAAHRPLRPGRDARRVHRRLARRAGQRVTRRTRRRPRPPGRPRRGRRRRAPRGAPPSRRCPAPSRPRSDDHRDRPSAVPIYEPAPPARRFGQGGARCTRSATSTSTIGEGEFVALVGPSGSGKTLLQLLGGLDRATDGAVCFEGVTSPRSATPRSAGSASAHSASSSSSST